MLYNVSMIALKDNEKLEDLQYNGLCIIQSSEEYRFTTDAVLLANYCNDMKGKLCVEFCAGSGVISILVAAKKRPAKVIAVELQSQLADMAKRSVEYNNLQDVVTVVCDDVKNVSAYLDKPADVVVCNPPYRKLGSGERQLANNLALCRHEIAITLSQVVEYASKVLNNRGTFYLVHQAERIAEIVCECGKNQLAVKDITPVCARKGTEPNLVLIRAVKCGGPDCKLHLPLIIEGV